MKQTTDIKNSASNIISFRDLIVGTPLKSFATTTSSGNIILQFFFFESEGRFKRWFPCCKLENASNIWKLLKNVFFHFVNFKNASQNPFFYFVNFKTLQKRPFAFLKCENALER